MAARHVIKFHLIAAYFKENQKQLSRGENAYTSGHVINMQFQGDIQPTLITGKVQASMNKATYYTVEITFDVKKGVVDSKCTCPRGQTICHHMAALVYHAHYNVSPTDTECKWIAKSKKAAEESVQSLEQMFPSKEDYIATSRHLTQEDRDSFQKKLGQTNVVGFSWLLKPEAEQTIFNLVPCIDDILFSEAYYKAEDKDNFFNDQCALSSEQIRQVSLATVGQHSNESWLITRKMRLTASKFGLVLSACERNKYPPSLFKQLLEGYNLNRALAVQWGKANEETALKLFENHMSIKVTATGLWLDPCGYLRASPDGLIGEDAILGIKCPWKFRNSTIKYSVADKTYFFYYNEEGDIVVKTDHIYYPQVQGQLYITNRQRCYFFVWTPSEQQCFVIERDLQWQDNVNILKTFYKEQFIPAMLDLK